MATYHEVLGLINRCNRMTQVELQYHFGWSDATKRQWIEALRGWEWIYPAGRVRLTEEGRGALERMNDVNKR